VDQINLIISETLSFLPLMLFLRDRFISFHDFIRMFFMKTEKVKSSLHYHVFWCNEFMYGTFVWFYTNFKSVAISQSV